MSKWKNIQLYWENRDITLTILCVCFNFLLLKFPSPPAASSDTGWISGRRAGSKILFMFWFSFHLLLKFWVYSKAEKKKQLSLYTTPAPTSNNRMWLPQLWELPVRVILHHYWNLGVFWRYIYTQRFYWRYCFSHRIYIWDRYSWRIRTFPGLASFRRN